MLCYLRLRRRTTTVQTLIGAKRRADKGYGSARRADKSRELARRADKRQESAQCADNVQGLHTRKYL